jgi:Na+-translocating ferredoxin:NAD+ oxidoreductase RnfE subunit
VLEPVVIVGLGMAPLLAVATELRAAFAIAVGLLAVQALTFLLMIAVRRFITPQLAPLFVVAVAAGWTTALRMICHTYLPAIPVGDTLSCWLLPSLLPTVNLSWLLFDEARGSKRSDGYREWMLANAGLAGVLCLLAAIREFLGSGTLWQIAMAAKPMSSWVLTSAGGCVIAAFLLLALAPLLGSPWAEWKE